MRTPYYSKPSKNNLWRKFTIVKVPKEIRDADIILFEGYTQHKKAIKRDKYREL